MYEIIIQSYIIVKMGTLYIVSTPIGNLEDITIRALKTLSSVDYIACEDTRRTGQLLKNLESKKPKLISYYDEIEFKRVPEIINLLKEGRNVALASDSGTPLISDPGFKLVKECIKQGIKIVPIPGPSSIITALTVSGLPPDKFIFLGFLPDKSQKRINLLRSILSLMRPHGNKYTIIAFEASHRLKEALSDAKDVFGDIEIALARELTKVNEEAKRGRISQILEEVDKIKGEIVLLFNIPPK